MKKLFPMGVASTFLIILMFNSSCSGSLPDFAGPLVPGNDQVVTGAEQNESFTASYNDPEEVEEPDFPPPIREQEVTMNFYVYQSEIIMGQMPGTCHAVLQYWYRKETGPNIKVVWSGDLYFTDISLYQPVFYKETTLDDMTFEVLKLKVSNVPMEGPLTVLLHIYDQPDPLQVRSIVYSQETIMMDYADIKIIDDTVITDPDPDPDPNPGPLPVDPGTPPGTIG